MKKVKEYKLFIINIILMTFLFSLNKLYDTDFFWHIKVGEWIINNKIIPTTDIFSWFSNDNPMIWYAHEWLGEVIFYLVFKVSGYIGLILLPAIFMTFIVSFIYKTNKKYFDRNIILFTLWMGLFLYEMQVFTVVRPQIFSYLFLAITMYILSKYKETDTKLIWILPIISILWINIHGGSTPILYVLILITIIGNLFEFNFQRIKGTKLSKKKIKNLGIVLIASILASCINQMGYKILEYPFKLTNNDILMNSISEWYPPDIKTFGGLIIFVILGIVILSFLVIKTEIEVYDLLILIAFTYLSLQSIRFISLFLIVITPILFKYIPEIKINIDNIFKRFKVKFILILLALFIAVDSGFILFSYYKNPIGYNMYNYPSDNAIQYIKNENPKRLLNHYNWGGYLIYNDIKVFMDGRSDMYVNYNYEDYLKIVSVKPKAKALLNYYNFDMIILPKETALNEYLKIDKDYNLTFEDDSCNIYIKAYD